jgi:selenocysteine lyase/cysteine desulfurase
MSPDFEALRHHFPTLETTVYLNSGSYGLLHDRVQAAFDDYLRLRIDQGADWDEWVMRSEAVRGQVAALLNVDPDEIAITASASSGMNAVASALDLAGNRNRVVVSNYEFPTSGQIWHAQEKRGATIVHVDENAEGIIPIDALDAATHDRTALVVLSHVCYRHGAKLPADVIRRTADVAHAHGALLLLDCYQSVGSESVDLRALDVDFAAGGMLKYLLGTAGIGFLYARRAVAETHVPTTTGWFAQAGDNMLNIFAHRPGASAARFQGGTPPVPSCYAAEAGLGVILDIGVEAIGSRVRAVTRYALDKLAQAGLSVATPDDDRVRGPMVAIRANDDAGLVQRLLDERIVTSSRDGKLRAGFHFYNNHADVDRFVDALTRNRDLVERVG